MKVLQVDSDVAYARQLRGELLRHGGVLCDLEHCATVEQAVQRLQEERFDVMVLDPFSQRDESLAGCSTLHAAAPDSPIVVLTSVDNAAVAVDAVRAGAHDFLAKRESQTAWLMRRIRYAIERCKYQQRHRQSTAPHLRAKALSMADAAVLHAGNEIDSRPGSEAHARSHTPQPAGRSVAWRIGEPLRVLHIEDDPTFARLARRFLARNGLAEFGVTHVTDWKQARAALDQACYDAILMDLSLPDRQGIATVKELLPWCGESPVLVLSAVDDDAEAIEAIQTGAEDFLIKGDINMRYLGLATLLAVNRRAPLQEPVSAERPGRRTSATRPMAGAAADREDPKTAEHAASREDRREHARYLLTRPVYAIPIRPDSSPAEAHTADGISVDVSAGGLQLELRNLARLPTKYLLVGVENDQGSMHYATMEARRVRPLADGLSLGARFVSNEHDLIRRENLEPIFRPESRRFETGLPLDVLARWCELGILRPNLIDRVLLCPQCQAVATFRKGCRACGSVRLHSRPMIHHFACAHVGFDGDFERDGSIHCPKCRTKNLIVGADYEHLNSPFRCLDCDWSDSELDLVGQCLRCELRFPANQAVEEDLVGYHVERLDPMAIVGAT